MIIWLASYPRSGNTLLRTVFQQTMGLDSLPERTEWKRLLAPGASLHETSRVFGSVLPDLPWEEFYPMATASEKVYLVKTHESPIDDQPAIYVVRNGRKAIYSYLHYHRNLLPEVGRSLLDLVAGHDYYGDWSSHFHAWNEEMGSAPRLMVRFEDLVDASPALVQRLAAFVGHRSEQHPWKNPFATLQQLDPKVFREGKTEWERPGEWTQEVEWIFKVFHGQLMSALDYEQPGFESDAWENWQEHAASTALQLLDSCEAMPQSVRRAAAENALLRARLQL